jgi:hypothetical protein
MIHDQGVTAHSSQSLRQLLAASNWGVKDAFDTLNPDHIWRRTPFRTGSDNVVALSPAKEKVVDAGVLLLPKTDVGRRRVIQQFAEQAGALWQRSSPQSIATSSSAPDPTDLLADVLQNQLHLKEKPSPSAAKDLSRAFLDASQVRRPSLRQSLVDQSHQISRVRSNR